MGPPRGFGSLSLVHARDGTAGSHQGGGSETRLGEGEVDLTGLFEALRTVEYAGTYIARRLNTASPAEDLVSARDFLSAQIRGPVA